MSDIRDWSTVAADNATAGSVNWAEGQPPSTVNDSAREMMANVRGWANDGGWMVWGDTHTYASGTSTTVSGDSTAIYVAGRRIRAVGSSTGTIYGSVASSSYSAPNTTINYTWDSGSLSNESLTVAVGQVNITGKPIDVTAIANLTSFDGTFTEGAAPSTPASGEVVVYAKTDGQMYSKDDAGVERPMSSTPAITGDYSNLVCKYVSVTTCDIDADEVIVKTTNAVAYVATAVDLTVDITVSGANGLDTGAEANSTWYYLYVIYNPATATVAGLISASSTAPTLPSGYTYKALVSAVYNDSSGNFRGYHQIGHTVWINLNVLNNATASAAGTYQSLSLTTTVPPIAKTVGGQLGSSLTSGASFIQVAGNSSGLGAQIAVGSFTGSSFDSYFAGGNFGPIALITAQTIFWRSLDNTSARNRMDITNWTF